MNPYKALWAAVLDQAISDLLKPRNKNTANIIDSAKFWLMDNNNQEINSFLGICETLQLDAKSMRRKILCLTSLQNSE